MRQYIRFCGRYNNIGTADESKILTKDIAFLFSDNPLTKPVVMMMGSTGTVFFVTAMLVLSVCTEVSTRSLASSYSITEQPEMKTSPIPSKTSSASVSSKYKTSKRNAGKTTILYHLLHKEFFTTTPTFGFNVETIQHHGDELTIWDMGGQKSIRGLWKHYIFQAQGIIFVVDSANAERLPEARHVLQALLRYKELDHVPVIILANKRDKTDVLTERALLEGLGLYDVTGRLCTIQCTCAITGDGLIKALDNIVNFTKRACEHRTSKSA